MTEFMRGQVFHLNAILPRLQRMVTSTPADDQAPVEYNEATFFQLVSEGALVQVPDDLITVPCPFTRLTGCPSDQ